MSTAPRRVRLSESDQSTSIMKSAQPSGKPGSYEDRRETHGFLVTSLVPSLKATHAASLKAHARCRASAANIRWCVGRKTRQRRVSVGRRASFERTRLAPPAPKKKKNRQPGSFDRRDARMRTNVLREPLDRGPSPHVSCQAKARVPICAPKDRFTRVLAASFTGAPRYTREVFILGSRSSLFSSPIFTKKNQKKPEKTQTPRPAAARRR